jgi:formate hydrogenlyase transcriptional activator
MADKGTLFLDEIGDIPLPLQPKLLRVLQEQEFERLGSGRTHRVNVRVVAATHRNLAEMVKRNEFRSDLYYRLNVFPVMLPPLRERRQDIGLLVSHFVEMFGQRMGKHIDQIPKETLDALTSSSWPGNVRELQNLIERAVILSKNSVLPNPLAVSDKNSVTLTMKPTQGTFSDSTRALI